MTSRPVLSTPPPILTKMILLCSLIFLFLGFIGGVTFRRAALIAMHGELKDLRGQNETLRGREIAAYRRVMHEPVSLLNYKRRSTNAA